MDPDQTAPKALSKLLAIIGTQQMSGADDKSRYWPAKV